MKMECLWVAMSAAGFILPGTGYANTVPKNHYSKPSRLFVHNAMKIALEKIIQGRSVCVWRALKALIPSAKL